MHHKNWDVVTVRHYSAGSGSAHPNGQRLVSEVAVGEVQDSCCPLVFLLKGQDDGLEFRRRIISNRNWNADGKAVADSPMNRRAVRSYSFGSRSILFNVSMIASWICE